MRILIVEDNPSIALDEEMLIEEMGYEPVGVADNGEDALLKIHEEKPDLILMDIQLKGKLTGLDIASQIRHLSIPVIFTTSFNDLERFEQARKTLSYGYLVKPFDQLSLRSAIDMAVRTIDQELNERVEGERGKESGAYRDYFMVKHNGLLHKVGVSDILYVQVEGNYSTLHTDSKKFVLKTSLKRVFEELDPERFLFIHKSYIVQLDKVQAIDTSAGKVRIGQAELPVGRNYKQELLDRFRMLK